MNVSMSKLAGVAELIDRVDRCQVYGGELTFSSNELFALRHLLVRVKDKLSGKVPRFI
jgi:hypothetical protein